MGLLTQHLNEYLDQRRQLGWQLLILERHNRSFLVFLAANGKTDGFTTQDAVTWARLPAEANPRWWSMRLGAVRTFSRYCHAAGLDVEIPPTGTLATPATRPAPYIYTQQDLDSLIDACAMVFAREHVKATMTVLLQLLAATGMRISEALRLTTADLDLKNSVLLVSANKHSPDRLVPVHKSTMKHLVAYRDSEHRIATRPAPEGPLIITTSGAGYDRGTIENYFSRIRAQAQIESRNNRAVRLHDFRHTFATRTMATAYRNGTDPQRVLSLLTTWLGHTSTAYTYWYLESVPELMLLAAQRLTDKDTP